MNQAQKEAYLREYSVLKNEGKPFFPYAVAKDGAMACIVMAVIIFLSLMFGAELGPKADPTTTTYVPRPDWYFFFLFEVLRVMRNVPKFTPMATIGVPTICMILLFLLPFYDRGPERRIERRPIALAAGITTIAAIAYLTYSGAHTGSPNAVELKPPSSLTASQLATWHAGAGRRRRVGLPRLPHARRQRQQRTRAGPDPHRQHGSGPADRLDAAQPDARRCRRSRACRRKSSTTSSTSCRPCSSRFRGPWRMQTSRPPAHLAR